MKSVVYLVHSRKFWITTAIIAIVCGLFCTWIIDSTSSPRRDSGELVSVSLDGISHFEIESSSPYVLVAAGKKSFRLENPLTGDVLQGEEAKPPVGWEVQEKFYTASLAGQQSQTWRVIKSSYDSELWIDADASVTVTRHVSNYRFKEKMLIACFCGVFLMLEFTSGLLIYQWGKGN